MVNVAGFLAVQQLTTNVTGHFAFFVDEVFKLNLWKAFNYFLYVFFFFLGSFSSNFLVELSTNKHDHANYMIPMLIECLLLGTIALSGDYLVAYSPNVIAFGLLFAMGLQNSLVTVISNATVRTTHLTGLFTDLGIELSQLFFYKSKEEQQKLLASIKLRFTIIGFFFIGGTISGILYPETNLRVLLLAVVILVLGLLYDYLKPRLRFIKRKHLTAARK